MQFRCTVKGKQFSVQADEVGGYTNVYFRTLGQPEVETVTYQLFPVVVDELAVPSSPAFLERVARIALGHFQDAEQPFPRVTSIGYTADYPTFTGELLVVQV